jgi:hypothetical protein
MSSSVSWGAFAVGFVAAGIMLLTAGNQSCYVSESKSFEAWHLPNATDFRRTDV